MWRRNRRLIFLFGCIHLRSKGFSASKNNTERDGLLNKTFSANFGGEIKTGTEWKAVVRHLQANAEYDQFSPTDAYEKEQLNSRVDFRQQAFNDQLTINASISYLSLDRFQASTQFDSETLSSDINVLAQHVLKDGLFGIETAEDTYKVAGYEQIEGDLNNLGFWRYSTFIPSHRFNSPSQVGVKIIIVDLEIKQLLKLLLTTNYSRIALSYGEPTVLDLKPPTPITFPTTTNFKRKRVGDGKSGLINPTRYTNA